MNNTISLSVLAVSLFLLAGCDGRGGSSNGGSGMVGGSVGMSPGTTMQRNTSYFANRDGTYSMPSRSYEVSWSCTGTVNLTVQWNDGRMMDYACVNNSSNAQGIGPGSLTMDFHQNSSANVSIL